MKPGSYVVITRPEEESQEFSTQLKLLGLQPFYSSTIKFSRNLSTKDLKRFLSNISSFDLIIFTSRNGVRFFMEGLNETKNNLQGLKNIDIATIGQKTADTAKRYGLSVKFVPSEFSLDGLIKELNDIEGENILLPRSNIGNPVLKNQLE